VSLRTRRLARPFAGVASQGLASLLSTAHQWLCGARRKRWLPSSQRGLRDPGKRARPMRCAIRGYLCASISASTSMSVGRECTHSARQEVKVIPAELATDAPVESPTDSPSTESPTDTPTEAPTEEPTAAPSESPTDDPVSRVPVQMWQGLKFRPSAGFGAAIAGNRACTHPCI
jgi:hypothetical protein